ncbi:hypothetical protein F2P81_006324 [Scophthalmus maximus]|uniref:Endonuclease/exonuclease/phosphatase domain-containing protein n=1 Tax=Scophthalmus maximus TaxID=52904 RepID=A0A6A4SYU6_SCOMX|nr:hypothetical protein F2P81_006324 [Scophthalmus maximus]
MFYRNRHLSYTNFPKIANRRGDGVAVYVKKTLSSAPNTLCTLCDRPRVCVYESPSSGKCVDCCCVQTTRLQLDTSIMDYRSVVVCGDFNQNLLSPHNNQDTVATDHMMQHWLNFPSTPNPSTTH